MKEKPIFHLFIPSLLLKLKSWQKDFLFEAKAPYLSQLLSEFNFVKKNHKIGLESAFFDTLNPDVSELPYAYYRYIVQTKYIKNGLICADPVHLEVSMNDVTLTQHINDLSDTEAQELIELLNKHFESDGLMFLFGSNSCWYVSIDDKESVQSQDLDSMLMKNIIGKLPYSKDRNWQVIQNEAQMLLHASDINQQREIAGLKPVNSLWFWGAGKPIVSNKKVNNLYSNSSAQSKLKGELFAKAAGCDWSLLPSDLSSFFTRADKLISREIIILDDLQLPTLQDNIDNFQTELTKLDDAIFKPLYESWKTNDFDIMIDSCDGVVLQPKKVFPLKFWIKPQSFKTIIKKVLS